ncbi:MAG: SPOR domain-containing protein, partial [Novosphingobium sp.]|nr:SPOR domain-containing protein [Novosphingobium sp.]
APSALGAPWGLQPGARSAAAPQQTVPAPQFQSLDTPSAAPARPKVLSKLDVPPGTPLAPPPAPQPRAPVAAPVSGPVSGPVSAPTPAVPQPVTTPAVAKPASVTPAPAPAPAPAPVQVAAATPAAAPPVVSPVASSVATTGPQLALAAPPPADLTAPGTVSATPAPPPPLLPPPPPAAAPTDFRSMFDGFKPPEQETSATREAVDLARIEALRESARAAAKTRDRSAKDRGERPDGPTAVSRTSDQDSAEPAVTRGGKDKAAKDAAEKDAKARKDKLALNTDCLDSSAKGKSGKSGKSKAASTRGKAASKTGAKSGRGKREEEVQCPPETGKAAKAKAKAELQHVSRIWVQVLTGANRAGMGKEWQRLVGTASALRGRKPSITAWRSNYRLLTGPFASDAEAQAFVEKLRGQGVSSYQWTSPAGQAVDGLSVK